MIDANPVRTLLKLAWPIVVSRSTQVVVGLCDALMVATLGKEALAATTTGAFNTFAVLILPMGICFIVASFASQLMGAGDKEGARRYGFYGLGIAAATQAICLLGIPLVAPILGLLDLSPAVRDQMTTYILIRFLGGGAVIGMEALASYYGGIGNTVLPMRANLFLMVLNVSLNWTLIGGNLGAPALGVAGAAWASMIATLIAFGALLTIFLRDRVGAMIPKLHLHELGRMLWFGVPSGFNWFFEFFAFNFFINVVVAGLGTASLAAMMAVIQINSLAFMPAFGLASAGAILVGQRIGADRKDEVPGVFLLTLKIATCWQGFVGIVYFLIPGIVFKPFAAGDQVLLEVGVRMLALSSLWQLFDAAMNTTAETLRAAGDTAFTLFARLALAWLVFVPGSWISVRWLGGGDVVAVLWIVAYIALLAGVLLWRFQSGAWRELKLVEEVPVSAHLSPE